PAKLTEPNNRCQISDEIVSLHAGPPDVAPGFTDLPTARCQSRSLTPMKSNLTGKSNCFKTSMKEKPTMRTGSSLVHLLLVMCAFLCTQLPLAHAADSAPTVTTDQADYPPGGTVYITGAGFQAGETVTNQVLHIPDTGDNNTSPAHQPWTVTADDAGNFSTTWDVPFDQDELGATLQLTATGQSSGLAAQATFTDSASLTLNAANPVTISPNADG